MYLGCRPRLACHDGPQPLARPYLRRARHIWVLSPSSGGSRLQGKADRGRPPRVRMTWSDSRQTTSDAGRIVAVMRTAQPPVVPAVSAGGSTLGVTAAPFIRSGAAAVVDLARRADRLGYGSFWVAEVTGIEAFSVLGAVSRAAPGLGLGTGVLPMQVRTPPLLAMAAASVQALAPGR